MINDDIDSTTIALVLGEQPNTEAVVAVKSAAEIEQELRQESDLAVCIFCLTISQSRHFFSLDIDLRIVF